MDIPISEYCKIGIVHFMLWKEALQGNVDLSTVRTILDDSFFDAIEMSWVKGEEDRRSVAEVIERSGKALGFGAQPVLLTQQLDLNSIEETERKRAVEAVIEVIPQAYELGAGGFALLSGKAVAPGERDAAMERLVQSLKEIAGALRERGEMPLILETFDQLPYGKNCLIGPNTAAAEVAKAVRGDFEDFGIMIDLSHIPLQGETVQEAVAAAKDYLVHAHMGNCVMNKPEHPMNGDMHPPLCDPDGENGTAELTEYLRALLDAGYLNKETRPILSFEVAVYKDWTQEQLIAQSKEVLESAWARV